VLPEPSESVELNEGNDAEGVEEGLAVGSAKNRTFWLGFLIPIMPVIIVFVLAMTGVFDDGDFGLYGLINIMCSICLWPILGLGIALSSETFVKNFRNGARLSVIIAFLLGGFIWLWFFSFISGGVTN